MYKNEQEYFRKLTDEQLIQLSLELQNSVVPNDALLRKVINDIKGEKASPAIILYFIEMSALTCFELGERLLGCSPHVTSEFKNKFLK